MNVLKRRALILTLLVLCLFGLTILGASAAVDSTTAATEASADSVASATVTVGSATPAVYYYTDLATAIAEADADTVVTVLQDTSVTSSIAIDKNLTVKSTDGSTFTVTKDAANTGYLFVVSGGAQFTISNINVATDGGFVDASGLTGTVTVGDGATVSGASSANPFFKVDTAATGTIAMASGSTLRVTSAPAAVTLFDINASLGKIDLNGNIVVGTETEPLALSADSVLFDVVSAATITTADFNGDIDVYAKSKKITFWQGGTAAINFKGVIDFHVTEYYLASDNGPMIQFLKDRDTAGTAKPLTITVNGGSINMTFGNAGVSGNSQTTGQTNNSAGYSAVFYMYNSASTLTVDNGSITAGASGHGFPMFYADVAFAVTVKGNSVLAQNGTNSSARIYAGGTSNATTFTVLADTNGTPVIKGSSSAVLFKSSITLAGDSVVIAGGTGFSYKTTTVTNMYFTTDAIAAAFGYAYRVNEQTLGGDGEYATAKKGYYKTLSEAQAAATGSGDVIYSAATGNVAFDSFDDDAAAIAAGFKFRVGALTNKLYAADLASAIDLAANNDTIYVLADVTVSTAVTLSGKAITIEGVTSSIKLTASATITMGAGAGLTIKNLAITLTVSPFIQVNAAASSLTLTDASIASDAERLTFRVTGGSANLAALTMTNVTLTGKAMVARVENGGTLASAAAPATITNLTTNYLMFYAYTAKLYVNVFGGSVGALVYGGDNHVNTIDVKYNPTGDTSTNISLASTSEYGSYVYQNPNGNTGAVLSFSFRNVTLVNTPTSAKGRIFHIPAVATITISAENSTFTTTAGQYVNFNSKINFNSDATARAFECGARVGDTEGLTASYYADVYTALGTVADGGTIWIIGNVKQTSEYTLTKSVTIKGINAQSVYTVTTSGNVPFFVQTNATLKFENVTYTLGARLARMDGNNSSLILASGAVMNHNGGGTGIFIYNNGNCDATPTYTIDFQAGSTVNATGALGNGLIYHNSADAAGTTATVYFNGTVKVTGNYHLVKDVDKNGQYIVYIDVSKVTCGATAWFSNVLHQIDAGGYATRLYAKGFASTEAAAAWGYSIGATAMTYSADPSKEWNYMFVNHGSMTYSQWENYLNSYGGEMWQLVSTTNIWWTHNLNNFGTVTMKSYNGATITGPDASYRIQLTNTTLILDGITIYGNPATIQLNAGTAAAPSALKLINGAKIICNTADSLAKLIKVNGACAVISIDETSNIAQSGAESTRITEAQLIAWGFTMREDSLNAYHNRLETAIAAIPNGSEATINILAPAIFGSPITLENKKVTIVGMDETIGDATYDLTYTGGDYMFDIYNLADLTFQNVNFKTGRPLIKYYSTALTTVAQDDKDITVSFINSYLDYNGSSRFIVSTNPGDSAANTQCDTFTFNVDETSTVSWVANSTDPRYMFYFNHGSHKYIVLNVAGTVSFKDHVTGVTNEAIFFTSNNPSGATVTFTETAHLIVDIADPIAADRIFYFKTGANKLTIHEKALFDEEGNLTLSGMRLFRQFSAGAAPATVIVADSVANEAAWLGLIGEDEETNAFSIIKYRAIADGTYYYTNTLSAAVERVNGSQGTAELYLFKNDSVSKGVVLDGVTFSLTGAEGVTLTSSATRLFKLTNGASLTITDLAITGTASTSSAATAGSILAFDDAEATAKSTATLTNVTLTANSSIPFYFGGVSVAELNIVGGTYSGMGMISFGYVASADTDTYFDGVANVTITGTAEKHAFLSTVSGGGDSASLIFVNSSKSVKDNVKVTLNYADLTADGHATYLRNQGTLTMAYSNGNLSSSYWVISSQSSAVPYVTFTNVTITGTSADHIMRPYAAAAGAYVKFIGGSITANNVTNEGKADKDKTPILNFNNANMTVSFDGVTFNSTSTVGLLGTITTCPTITAKDCAFNLTGPILYQSNTALPVMLKGNTTVNSTAMGDENASTYGFSAKVLVGEEVYYVPLLNSFALSLIPTGGTGSIKLLAQHTLSAEISFQDKSVTLIGADAVVDDTNYDLIYTGTDNTFRIYDVGTLTLQNMNVKTGGTFFRWDSSKYSAKATADKNITLALVDTYVTVESTTASYFVGSVSSNDDNHLACNTFTLEMDDGSAVDFTSSASKNSDTTYGNHSFNFIYGNDNSHPYVAANIHGQVDISFTNEEATPFLFIRENNVSGINLNVTDTAKLKVALADPTAATTAYLAACWTGATSRNIITIALSAITENGALTLGDVSLYVASAGCEPQVCIIAGDTTLQAALLAWEKLISYRVDYDGKYHYYTLLDNAKDAADANVTVVVYLRTLPDVEAAVEVGAIFRLGGATDQGVMGQHYFTKIADLIECAATQSMTDITVYVLTSGKTDSSAITLTGIKMTLTSYGSKQTLTLSGAPAFKLDADSHLVVDNVKIEVTNAFAQVVNADTAKYTKLDLEAGAYVDLKAATANGSKYFLMIANVTNTGILTVNVKQGAVINATANATGGTQGLFQISATRHNAKVAAGSSINVNGEINFSQNYTSTGYAPIFMVNNPNLVININDGATVTLGHTGTTGKNVWHAIFCFDDKATVNIGNATLRANADGALFGINGAGCGAVLTVTGATFTAENFPMGVIDGWTKDTSSYNSQKVTFNNCTFTGNVASHSRMTGIVLNNATFNSLAHAQANFASLRVGSSDTTGYYSKFAGAIEATSDGGTLWVIADMSDSDVSIINKSLTIQGIDANDRPLITNSSDGSTRIFTCKGNVVLTLKDLEINAKARLVWFGCETYVETVDDVETTQFIDVTASGLSLYNVDAYGLAVGTNHNDMIGVGDNKGHHNFDLYIDETSSVGYLDGDPATIRSTRDYQVIFYYASVTGDIVIEGDVFAYVYFTGDQVNYAKVIANNPAGSWAANAPNSQHMIQIGSGGHTFMGDIIIKGNLTHKVVFPSVDENGNRVYPEDYPTLHSAYAIYVSGASAGVFVADGATITLDYENEYQPNAKAICFAGSAADYETTCDDGATAGRYHYYGVGALIAFLNNNAYKNNRLTVATPSGSSYGIVYDASTFISTTVEEDTGIAGSGGHDYYGANEIAALLSKLTGATVSATKDDTSSTYEIIVGIANRALVETYLPQLEMNEYAIIMKDNKILILAWHDAALNKGVAAFKYALQACADGTTVYLPALDGIYKGVANESWITNFTKPANGTLWGGQYVNDNSLQYVYNGYADAQAGHEALNAYCAVLESEGYTLVWQNVIENNLFRMYQNTESGIALYVAYNDYTYKDKYYGTNGLYAQDEALLESEFNAEADFNDDYFEHRDHQKVLRVVSMPLSSVTLPDDGILQLDMSYDKVDNTAMTTLSFQSTSVGLGHVYMLEDGRFVVVDGGGAGFTSEGDVTEPEAIWQVMNKMYENAYGKTPEENGDVIHIAAWYLTHAHWDHHTAFTNMLKAHGAQMKMDYMIGNFMAADSTYRNHATSFTPSSWTQYVNGGFKYVKVYTGQRIYLANLEIEVLMTYMDHAPFDIINSNDSNTVTRFSIHNKDAMNGVTAQVLYLGDSWRHSSRILCEMYDGYLQTEIVQLAHHGNIGCERVLYKAVAPRAVLFSHNGSSFQSYVYFSNIVTNEDVTNAHKTVAFRYGANVWCAANAEYVWSAPYGTYNVLEFLPARPDYENVHELGIQPSATEGTTPSYDTSYDRENATRYNYIHNASNGYKSVNVVWGDFSFSYEGGSAGIWSPETLRYESANDGEWVANGNNKIWVGNASTGNDQNVNVQLSFTAAEGYTNFTGIFKQNGEVVAQNTNVALASKEYKEFEFFLDTTSLPGESLDDQVIGSITVTLK